MKLIWRALLKWGSINKSNCGNALRALTTKLQWEHCNGEVSDQGMVILLRIGQPDASKHPGRMKVHRPSFLGVGGVLTPKWLAPHMWVKIWSVLM
nr:MAG TPA: hypothetical protein [Caudoviricetes sp.]